MLILADLETKSVKIQSRTNNSYAGCQISRVDGSCHAGYFCNVLYFYLAANNKAAGLIYF